jgi:hypothetical protein
LVARDTDPDVPDADTLPTLGVVDVDAVDTDAAGLERTLDTGPVGAEELQSRPEPGPMVPILPIATLVIPLPIFLLFGWARRRALIEGADIEDPQALTRALALWRPVVGATPRAWKRFENRVRFEAIRRWSTPTRDDPSPDAIARMAPTIRELMRTAFGLPVSADSPARARIGADDGEIAALVARQALRSIAPTDQEIVHLREVPPHLRAAVESALGSDKELFHRDETLIPIGP